MRAMSIFAAASHSKIALLMNSGPLSERGGASVCRAILSEHCLCIQSLPQVRFRPW